MSEIKIIIDGPLLVDTKCCHCSGTRWLKKHSSWKKCDYCDETGLLTSCPYCMSGGISLGLIFRGGDEPEACPHCEASGVLTGEYAHSNIK